MTNELKPCPFCGAELHFEGAGYEHPYSDTCPLDSLYIEDRHITAWNTRADADLRREREPVKVKPLVWETDGSDALVADVYRIGINYGLTSHQFWLLYRDYAIATANDHDALKAAAQADYAARIRAALIPVPDTLRQVREALEGITGHDALQDPEYMSESLNDALAACRAALALLAKE